VPKDPLRLKGVTESAALANGKLSPGARGDSLMTLIQHLLSLVVDPTGDLSTGPMPSIPRTSFEPIRPHTKHLLDLDTALGKGDIAEGVGSLEGSNGGGTVNVQVNGGIETSHAMGAIA
jgi:hypothetical protein|tara:strand:+ start:1111 stop:1467 length:357 start_codon:yes stop_codon:yes gene_type:complete